jgi:hypothetical protein
VKQLGTILKAGCASGAVRAALDSAAGIAVEALVAEFPVLDVIAPAIAALLVDQQYRKLCAT